MSPYTCAALVLSTTGGDAQGCAALDLSQVMPPVEDDADAASRNRVELRTRRARRANYRRAGWLVEADVGLNHQSRALIQRKPAEQAPFEDRKLELHRVERDLGVAGGWQVRRRNDERVLAAVVIKTDAHFATENDLEPPNARGNAGLPGDQAAVDGLQYWLGGEAQNGREHDEVARYQPERRAETNVDRAAAGNCGDTAGLFADAELGEDQTVA